MKLRNGWLALASLCALAPAQDPQAEARKLIEAGRYAEGLKQIEKLPVLRPPRPEVSRLVTIAWSGLGDWEQVVNHGAAYLQTTPKDVAIQVKVGEALYNLGCAPDLRNDKAMAYGEQALECAEAALQVSPGEWAALDLKVRTMVFTGRDNDAVEFARALTVQAPGQAQAWKLLAFAYEGAKAVGDAVAVLRQAEGLAAGSGWALVARGLVHERAGQRDEALRAFTAALKAPRLDQDDVRTAAERIWSLCGFHKDWAAAHRMIDAWIGAHPQAALAWWWRGYVEELQENAEAAEGSFQRAWDLSQQSLGDAALHLGHAALRRKDEKAALGLFSDALKLKAAPRPGVQAPVEAIIGIAAVRFTAGKLKEAADILERHGAKHAPDHPKLRQNLGFLMREMGSDEARKKNLTKARDFWTRSARHYEVASEAVLLTDEGDTTKAQILNDTGLMFHYHLDQVDKGIAYYRRALEFDPAYLDALENMGVAMSVKKEWTEAVAWFDRVLAIVPDRRVSVVGKNAAEAALLEQKK